jgi:GTPase
VGLARAIDVEVVDELVVQLGTPVPATLMGRGKVTEIAGRTRRGQRCRAGGGQRPAVARPAAQPGAGVVGQGARPHRLILEIFGRRARTREGALQVEHAHLSYQKSRLVRSWTHLERQRGGFGFIGGPGETQIEADRRLIQERLTRIEKQLDKVKRTRQLHRKGRERVPFPIVALVGYTNAGKSTLFNKLTAAGVDARDLLFATLDPTMRRVRLAAWPRGHLFRHRRLHRRPADQPDRGLPGHARGGAAGRRHPACPRCRPRGGRGPIERRRQGARRTRPRRGRRAQIIEVWNKADLLAPDQHAALAQAAERRPGTVLVSAVAGTGSTDLLGLIEARLAEQSDVAEIAFAPEEGAEVAWLHDHAEVLERTALDDGTLVLARPPDA